MTPDLIGQAKEFLRTAHPPGRVGLIGDLAVDRFISGSVDRISPEAPVPVLLVDRETQKPGCAANVCLNLLELGSLHVDLFGLVGRDRAGDDLLRELSAVGTATLSLHVLADGSRPTTLKTRYLAGAQHQLLRVDEERTHTVDAATEQRLWKDLEMTLPSLGVLIVQDYAKGLLSAPLLQKIFRKCRELGVKTILDPNRATPAESYRGAYLITPNLSEAETLLGRSLHRGENNGEIETACIELRERLELSMVMITRSAHGITLLDDAGRIHHFPAIARAVFDVTGAGDTVVAVFAGAYVNGAGIPVACTLATAAASVVVGKVGTATARVSEILAELDHFTVK